MQAYNKESMKFFKVEENPPFLLSFYYYLFILNWDISAEELFVLEFRF